MTNGVDNDTLQQWFNLIMKHAKNRYEQNGWDIFVECVDVEQFIEDYNNKKFVDYYSALGYYMDVCKLHDERRKDIEAEAF